MAEIKSGIFAKNVQKRLNRAQEKVRVAVVVQQGGGETGMEEVEGGWRTPRGLEAAGPPLRTGLVRRSFGDYCHESGSTESDTAGDVTMWPKRHISRV